MMIPWTVLYKVSGPGHDSEVLERQDYILPAEATEEQQKNMALALAGTIFQTYQTEGLVVTTVAVFYDARSHELLLTIENLRNTLNSFNNLLS